MGVVRITQSGYVPADTCYTYNPQTIVQYASAGVSTTDNLKRWARNIDALAIDVLDRNLSGAILSASVVWPDGAVGTYTADTVSLIWPWLVDAYHITYGTPTSKTFTQPLMTRNASGLVIDIPDIVVS